MGYPPRPQVANGVYHVWTRGTARSFLCLDDEDRSRLVRLLGLALARYEAICHAYCVLGTHYHFVLRTPNANIGDVMRGVNGGYFQTFNRRHGRFGHLVAARYDAKLVDSDEYAYE